MPARTSAHPVGQGIRATALPALAAGCLYKLSLDFANTTYYYDHGALAPGTQDSVGLRGPRPGRWAGEDVDRDGDLDLLLNFKIQDLELDASSTEATLTGETFPHFGGLLIQGTDTVKIIP